MGDGAGELPDPSFGKFRTPRWREGIRSRGCMKDVSPKASQSGKIGWILLWLIGVPVPVLIILFLLRGCT